MSAVTDYRQRMTSFGATRRERTLRKVEHDILRKAPENTYFQKVLIDGVEQGCTILRSDFLDAKYIYSLPGEDIRHGGLVFWKDRHWLVVEKDPDSTIYIRAFMKQCNHLLKWIDADHQYHEQWCVVSDSNVGSSGDYRISTNVTTMKGETRLAMYIARNADTVKFDRTTRFIIDDTISNFPMAYYLTKPMHMGDVYDEYGVYKFVLSETNVTSNDNIELGIADYYKHFPKGNENYEIGQTIDPDEAVRNERKSWL